MTNNYFKDQSPFDGVREFDTPTGRIRAMNKQGVWEIYILSENRDAYIFSAKIRSKGNNTCQKIYDAYMSLEE